MTSRPKLRIAIDTDGSRSLGIGHVLRSLVLSRGLTATGAEVTWLHRPRNLSHPALSSIPKRTGSRSPDVLVIDRPDTTKALIDAHHERWPSTALVLLDYYGAPARGVSAVINLNLATPNHWPKRLRPAAYYEGLRFATLREHVTRARRRVRAPRARMTRVLVGFGGTDPSGWTLPATLAVAATAGATVDVIGAVDRKSAAGAARVKWHGAVAEPSALFAGADLCVIGGGTMLIEAACLGVPAIVIPRTRAEAVFARSFAMAGTAKVLPVAAGFPRTALASAIARLRPRSVRASMHRAGRTLVDGRGRDRVVKAILRAGARP